MKKKKLSTDLEQFYLLLLLKKEYNCTITPHSYIVPSKKIIKILYHMYCYFKNKNHYATDAHLLLKPNSPIYKTRIMVVTKILKNYIHFFRMNQK